MKLIVTIDTEEDNWAHYSATDNPVQNIEQIIKLQSLFDRFGITPTYLVTYPVATNPRSVSILKRILYSGKCEIGMHCHPWNTPPFNADQKITEHDTMLCNLPEELQYLKLANLHDTICKQFGVAPISSRVGRWGFGSAAARSLDLLDYRVDTSVTPFVSWQAYQGPDFSDFGPDVFRFTAEGLSHRAEKGALLQVPATIGFLQSDFVRSRRLWRLSEGWLGRRIRMRGVLDRLGLLNKVWLSPELADADSMIRLGMRMQRNNYPCLNMTFHSTSLMVGLSPFVRTVEEEKLFLNRITTFLLYAHEAGWESQTLSRFEHNFRDRIIRI